MKKIMICCAACLMALCAWAQEPTIDAVHFEQGETSDWYMLSTTPKVTVGTTITIAGKTYDLTQGDVKTTFGTAPIPPANIEVEPQVENQDSKAVKFIHNGQLIIRKDGKNYNVLGGRVK